MDDDRFDALARRLRSRRDALAALAAFGVAIGAVRSAAAIPCGANGSACDPSNPLQCCTGHCKKHKGKYICAPFGAPLGCSKKRDSCSSRTLHACPERPAGLCVNLSKGKPLCISAGEGLQTCAACTNDDDCVTDYGPTARCIRHCNACARKAGIGSACVVPYPVA